MMSAFIVKLRVFLFMPAILVTAKKYKFSSCPAFHFCYLKTANLDVCYFSGTVFSSIAWRTSYVVGCWFTCIFLRPVFTRNRELYTLVLAACDGWQRSFQKHKPVVWAFYRGLLWSERCCFETKNLCFILRRIVLYLNGGGSVDIYDVCHTILSNIDDMSLYIHQVRC